MDRSTFLAQLHGRYTLPRPALDELVERVTGHRSVETQRLVRGDENEVYRIVLANDRTVFVRAGFPDARPGNAAREAAVMEQARAAGVPAPAVLAVETLASEQGDRQTMIVQAAPGIQLSEALPMLSRAERTAAMQNLGRLLGRLSSVRMPGYSRPDDLGRWPDPAQDRRRYLAAVRADGRGLDQAGLSRAELDRIDKALDDIAAIPVIDPAVLCHHDISAEHVFTDADQNITGLIDWGMWSGGSPADDLAVVSTRFEQEDYANVLTGHPGAADTALHKEIAISVLTQSIGGLAWLIRSGQSHRRADLVTAIRRALEVV